MQVSKYRLEVVVFIVGACVMAVEITGSRILAPYFGTSVIVWTSLIGIVLAALSGGYAYGGRLADKNPKWEVLSLVIFLAALYVGLVSFSKDILLYFLQRVFVDVRLGSTVATIILLGPPSFLLGIVSPYAVRLKIRDLKKTGKTAGSLYAISTVGSIFGTFLAGYFLLSYLGNTYLLNLISFALLFSALICFGKLPMLGKLLGTIFLFFCLAASFVYLRASQEGGIVDRDTLYNRVWIFNTKDPASDREIKVLRFDPKFTQSAIFLDDNDLVMNYTKYLHSVDAFVPKIERVLVVGGAAYVVPRDLLLRHKEAKVDVVEIDPEVTSLAKQYFGLAENERLSIIHEDARTFFERGQKQVEGYDLVLLDAFGSSNSVPFHLTTVESYEGVKNLLSSRGIVAVNVISAVEGKNSEFFRAEFLTLRSVFPYVFTIPVENQRLGDVQNVILIGSKTGYVQSSDSEILDYLSKMYEGKVVKIPILTDDFAPVDNYMANALN